VKIETRVGIFIVISIGIFFYLSLNIGAIRLDQRLFYLYKTYFDDTGGLDEKASVKIAGVEVGWVEKIELLEGGKAEANDQKKL
jgi:phospholipid/cholesterol/gamma-HCH transport system substrate-binding protein